MDLRRLRAEAYRELSTGEPQLTSPDSMGSPPVDSLTRSHAAATSYSGTELEHRQEPRPVSGRARQPDQNLHCSRHRGRSTRADKRCRATHLRGQRATVECPLVVAAEVGCVMTPSEIVRARSTRSFVDCAGIVMGPRGRLQRDIAVRRGLLPGVPALTKAAASHAAPPGPPLHKFMSCDACKTTIDLFHSQLRPRKFARTFAAQRGDS